MRRRTLPFLLLVALVALGAALSDQAFELRNRGVAQLENERPAEAEAIYRQLIKLTPGEPLGHANLAVAALRQQKNDEALAAIDQALALAPANGDLLALKGEILKWAGKPEEALSFYKQAAAAAHENLEVVNALYAHASSMQSEEATRAAGAALVQLGRLRPENLVVMLRLGQAAVARGDRTAATGAYLRVRELLWQAPPIAGKALELVLAALEETDVSKARVPALRLENVLKVTPMYQQSQRELTEGIVGIPVERFAGEPPPSRFGEPVPVSFVARELAGWATDGLAVGDFDGDGRPDIASSHDHGLELRTAAGPTEPKRYASHALSGELVAIDLDNDGFLDLLRFGQGGVAVQRLGKGGEVEAGAPRVGLPGPFGKNEATALVAFDFDVEGDLDLVVAGEASGKPFVELYRNSLEESLEAVGARAFPKLGLGRVHAVLASDLDCDGDLDLLLAHAKGLTFLDNLRQGRFAVRTAEIGLAGAGAARAVVSADLDNDGWPELIAAGPGLTVWDNHQGRFTRRAGPSPLAADAQVEKLLAFDADNDGRLDLAIAGAEGLRVLKQGTSGRFEPVTATGVATGGLTSLAAADLDGDGDLDLVAGGPKGLFQLDNQGGNKNGWLQVHLRGLAQGNSKNNLFGVGSVVEVRAGSAYQVREATGDVVHFGLGSRAAADSLRVVWTNGVPQQRLQPKRNQTIVEEQVLKGSCPFLYVWNGSEIEFVTDLLWNAPLGLPVAPGAWASADPRELVEAPSARPRDGVYRMRVTEELWEAAFFDQLRLWVVDRPTGVEVASNLRVIPGATVDPANLEPERVLGARHVRPVAAAWDGAGRDVTDRVARRDGVYAAGYAPSRYQGVASEWAFTFDLGPELTEPTRPSQAAGRPIRLLLDGWIFPADASLNLAVAQRADLPYVPPRLEVETAAGWKVLLPAMGHPAGKTKTMVVDTPPLPEGTRRLRIVTSLWLHWDRIAWSLEPVDTEEAGGATVIARLTPSLATLRFGGFSTPLRTAPNAPHHFDYAHRQASAPWLPFPGRYTRYGDVRELLATPDDRSVILAAGDEIALEFDASALPPPPPGMERTVFLESFGWDKDADRNTWRAKQVEPLPFRAMSGYPYGEGEAFPETPEHRAYRRSWLTREIATPQPSATPLSAAPLPLLDGDRTDD